MRNTFFLLLVLVAALMLASCEAGDTGNFKIRLRLPIDDDVCGPFIDDDEDYTYCIQDRDQVLLSIYTSSTPSGEYVYADRKLIRVRGNTGGKEEFIRSLKKGTYYRFFVEVTNANEKLKLTGGLDSILYDDDKNFEVDIFLGAVGDFVRVVGDRKRPYDTSLLSYFESGGSKGAAAAALKGGKLYLSGGYSFDMDMTMRNTTIFDLKTVSSKKAADLNQALADHVAAFLDDGSETGKVVVAFGTTDEGVVSNEIKIYDPEKDKYRLIETRDSVTRAKAITIDGDVYIVGGCNKNSAGKKIYKVDKVTQIVSDFATLQTGRCNHAIADVSYTKEDGTFVPRILVIGGSIDENGDNPVLDNFVEIATINKSVKVDLADRYNGDSVELLKKGLISPAASALKMDDLEESETVVAVVGGYLQDGDEETKNLIVSSNLYVFSETGENKWVYDVNAGKECARPSAGAVGAAEKSTAKYMAVNCGTKNLARTSQAADAQAIYVVQVKRTPDKDLGINVFSASVRESLLDDNRDPENGIIVDGPTAVNQLGQVFVFGTEYVYQISGYAIP
jgi:hypothetical protein